MSATYSSNPQERIAKAYMRMLELLQQHNLPEVKMGVNSNLKSTAGYCYWNAQGKAERIELAEWLVENADWSEVEDTILHEIAHAIAGPRAGHGWEWQRVAARIGAKPERCYGEELHSARPPAKYKGKCGCGMKYDAYRLGNAMREKRNYCPDCGQTVHWFYNN